MRKIVLAALMGAVLPGFVTGAAAQSYPTRPVTLILGFAPGCDSGACQ